MTKTNKELPMPYYEENKKYLSDVLEQFQNGDMDKATILILNNQLHTCLNDLKSADEYARHLRETITELDVKISDLINENKTLESCNLKLMNEVAELEGFIKAKSIGNADDYAYYYVAYTTDERGSQHNVPKYFNTLEEAKEEMKNHSNFWEAKGTGFVYGVKFGVPVVTQLVYEK